MAITVYDILKILQVLSLLLITSSAFSQNFDAFIIGGFNVSQIEGDKLSGYNKAGIIFGAATRFKLKEPWSFQQEIVYYQRGSRATDKELNADNFSFKRLDYIDILLLGKYMINEDWSIIGGLGIGAFIHVKSDVVENKSVYKPDLFGTLGAEYALSPKWVAAVKGQYSLITISKIQDAYNNTLNFSLRYRLF
ncbi:MAG TPA: outer membrane beta-barrel protein [Fulvivirga sp.]|nr:outer membrane beta-barrel protein [Fulvivirga sp.]